MDMNVYNAYCPHLSISILHRMECLIKSTLDINYQKLVCILSIIDTISRGNNEKTDVGLARRIFWSYPARLYIIAERIKSTYY